MIKLRLESLKLDKGVLIPNPDFDTELREIADNLRSAFGANRVREGDNIRYEIENDLFTHDWFLYVYSKGGTVEGYYGYLRIPETKMPEDVPAYMPGYMKPPVVDVTDPENPVEIEPERPYTWDEYTTLKPTIFPRLIHDGQVYIRDNCGTGKDLTSSQILSLWTLDQIKDLSIKEYREWYDGVFPPETI